MSDTEPDSPIQIYCTVKRDELESAEAGLVCTRCQRTLKEVHPGEDSPTSGCGFIRKSALPVVASSLFLSSCVDPQQEPEPEPSPPHEETKQEELILPGIVCPPDPTSLNKSDYPTAERVVGRPKWIISPYTGKHVDVEGLPAGSLAIDPTSKIEEKKYFVIPPELE